MKFSVIVPAYNDALFIKDAIKSVLNQTYKDLELIIIDDFSTDNTVELIKSVKDERLTLIELSTNLGTAKCRNIGMNIAKGDYIMFLDHDDMYDVHLMETLSNSIKQNPNFNVYAYWYHKCDSEAKGHWNHTTPPEENIYKFFEDKRTPGPHWAYVWTHCFKRDFLNKFNIRFLEERGHTLGEDIKFMYALSIIDQDSYFIGGTPLYYHRVHDNQLTKTRKKLSRREGILKKHEELFYLKHYLESFTHAFPNEYNKHSFEKCMEEVNKNFNIPL